MADPRLTASFVLKLEDRLSPGLVRLQQRLERLARMAGRLRSLGDLSRTAEALRGAGGGADALARKVGGVGNAATRSVDQLRRLARQAAQPIRLGPVVAAGIAAGSAGIAGRLPGQIGAIVPPGSASHAGVRERTTALAAMAGRWGTGPGYGVGPQGRAQAAMAGMRDEFGRTASAAGALRHSMGELGEGAMRAAVTGFGLMEPIKQFAEYQNLALHMAITAGKGGQDAVAFARDRMALYDRIGLEAHQRSTDVIESANLLYTSPVGPEKADKLLPQAMRAATAYNAPAVDTSKLVVTLSELLKLKPEEMAGALSAVGQTGKLVHMTFAEFAQLLPETASAAGMRGIEGRKGLNEMLASIAVSRLHAGTAGEAVTNYRDLLAGLTSRHAKHGFEKRQVDLIATLNQAEEAGQNPVDAVVNKLIEMTRGMSNTDRGDLITQIFGNQQGRTFIQARLAEIDRYKASLDKLTNASDELSDHDFATASLAPAVLLRDTYNKLDIIVRRLGQGLSGALGPLNVGLGGVLAGMQWLDAHFPGLLDGTLGWTGGLFAATAALGLLKPVLGVVLNGAKLLLLPFRLLLPLLRLLANPVGALRLAWAALGTALSGVEVVIGGVAAVFGAPVWVVLAAAAAIAGAAYLIWRNWGAVSGFFVRLWDGVRATYDGFGAWVEDWAPGAAARGLAALRAAWRGLEGVFSTLWIGAEATFNEFVSWVDGWSGGMATEAIKGIKDAWNALPEFFKGLLRDCEAPFVTFASEVEGMIPAWLRPGAALGMTPNADGTMTAPDGTTVQPFKQFTLPGVGSAAPGRAQVEMTLHAAPGTAISGVRSSNADVRARPASGTDRGQMVGRD